MKTLIVIPVRMAATRFPNKPMALISGKTMIQRVWEQAIESKLGNVIVACCDNEVYEHITSLGGEAVMTDPTLPSGTDRVFEAIKNYNNTNQFESFINLQGDMPVIDPKDIQKSNFPLLQGFDIGSLVTNFKDEEELRNKNFTKTKIEWIKNKKLGKATDFRRDLKFSENKEIFHHVGIYSFRFDTLKKFVSLSQSFNEKQRKLEQMRAIDAKMTIGVTFVSNVPLSVDTEEDLLHVEKLINQDE